MAERFRQFASAAAAAAVSISRPNYFDGSKRGENYEIKNELNSDLQIVKKEAVKKVIANMTVGKDASGLFADVVKCMQTDDLELKKLVYLYLMNYAKSQPELVILAVNTFCKDTEDPNPLIRALAIRTMGCIRVERILDYICEPLRRGVKDDNAYVRKTAAICLAKVFDLSAEFAQENGFVEMLQDMLGDPNPMVMSNVVAALADIQSCAPVGVDALKIDSRILSKLLAALNDCTEWGQVTIMDAIAVYRPMYDDEVESTIERVIPRLQHVNTSVVMSAVKVLIIYMEFLPDGHEMRSQLIKKLAPPLVSMLSSAPEVQFVALRNINLILQRHPNILSQGVRVFFCKYNDPLYVKLEKLESIKLLVDEANVEQVLAELSEYAKEVDVEFVRKAIQAIGHCAIELSSATGRVVAVLLDLARTTINYIVQEVAVVARLVLRQYPGSFPEIVPLLCEHVEILEYPEPKTALLWLVGEYGCDAAESVLSSFVENFRLEPLTVQMQLISSCVRYFLKSGQGESLMTQALLKGRHSSESADLRDHSIFYTRLLAADPALIKRAMLDLPTGPVAQSRRIDPATLDMLLANISTLASVFHKPARLFSASGSRAHASPSVPAAQKGLPRSGGTADLLDLDFSAPTGEQPKDGDAAAGSRDADAAKPADKYASIMDLLGDEFAQ